MTATQRRAYGKPVHPRHHDIEYHQVGNVVFACFKQIGPLFEGFDLIALPGKERCDELADVLLVVGKVNAFSHRFLFSLHANHTHDGSRRKPSCHDIAAV